MIKLVLKIALVIGSVYFIACKPAHSDLYDDFLIATWVFNGYNSETDTYEYVKRNSLEDRLPGYIFEEKGNLISRQNAGWCGTEPISYANFTGIWKYENDSTLRIKSSYWGSEKNGPFQEFDLKIMELGPNNLKVQTIE